MPLAILQAAGYMNMTDASVHDYLEFLSGINEAEVMNLLSENLDNEIKHSNAQNSIASTWLISFEASRKSRPGAAH